MLDKYIFTAEYWKYQIEIQGKIKKKFNFPLFFTINILISMY